MGSPIFSRELAATISNAISKTRAGSGINKFSNRQCKSEVGTTTATSRAPETSTTIKAATTSTTKAFEAVANKPGIEPRTIIQLYEQWIISNTDSASKVDSRTTRDNQNKNSGVIFGNCLSSLPNYSKNGSNDGTNNNDNNSSNGSNNNNSSNGSDNETDKFWLKMSFLFDSVIFVRA